jgi:hypothetical protein
MVWSDWEAVADGDCRAVAADYLRFLDVAEQAARPVARSYPGQP